jgi:hypothetical protein
MKQFFYTLLILLVLIIGINIGSSNEKVNSLVIKDKIEQFENNINNQQQVIDNNIKPNIFNKVASKCNSVVDSLVDKVKKMFSE